MAAGITGAITLALTLYAMTTKTDFTIYIGIIWVCAFAFMFMGLFFWWFPSNPVMNIIWCTIGAILYGIYLIVDTQMIIGGKRFELDFDYYILGALMLFIDIIGMFLYILSALVSR